MNVPRHIREPKSKTVLNRYCFRQKFGNHLSMNYTLTSLFKFSTNSCPRLPLIALHTVPAHRGFTGVLRPRAGPNFTKKGGRA